MTRSDTMQTAFARGEKDFAARKTETMNPYRLSSDEALAWLDGWQTAHRKATPIVKGGQGRSDESVAGDASAFGALALAALILVLIAGCNSFSRLYGG